MTNEDKQPIISRETLVPLGAVCALFIALLAGAWQFYRWSIEDTRWKAGIEYRLKEIQSTFDGKISDRWTRADMRRWAREFSESNEAVAVPRVPEAED